MALRPLKSSYSAPLPLLALGHFDLPLDDLNRALEAAVLLCASEAGYARDCRSGTAFGKEEDRLRFDAFGLGALDSIARALLPEVNLLPLFAYLKALMEHGPGDRAREAALELLSLAELPQLKSYVAGGRRMVLRMLGGAPIQTGYYASLLEEELEQRKAD